MLYDYLWNGCWIPNPEPDPVVVRKIFKISQARLFYQRHPGCEDSMQRQRCPCWGGVDLDVGVHLGVSSIVIKPWRAKSKERAEC